MSDNVSSGERLTESETRQRLWVGRVPKIIRLDKPLKLSTDAKLIDPDYYLEEFIRINFLYAEGSKPNRNFKKSEVENMLWDFAWHESGHAVTGEEYNFKSEGISIVPYAAFDGIRPVPYDLVGARAPVKYPFDLDGHLSAENAEQVGIWMLAGRFSQQRGTGRDPRDDWKRGADLELLKRAAREHPVFMANEATYLQFIQPKLEKVIEKNWNAIQALAQSVYSQGELDGDGVREIINQHGVGK
jgi:hypothetical protein